MRCGVRVLVVSGLKTARQIAALVMAATHPADVVFSRKTYSLPRVTAYLSTPSGALAPRPIEARR